MRGMYQVQKLRPANKDLSINFARHLISIQRLEQLWWWQAIVSRRCYQQLTIIELRAQATQNNTQHSIKLDWISLFHILGNIIQRARRSGNISFSAWRENKIAFLIVCCGGRGRNCFERERDIRQKAARSADHQLLAQLLSRAVRKIKETDK